MLSDYTVMSELNDLKIKAVWIEYILSVLKIQEVVSLFIFSERNLAMMSHFTAECLKNLRYKLILDFSLFL